MVHMRSKLFIIQINLSKHSQATILFSNLKSYFYDDKNALINFFSLFPELFKKISFTNEESQRRKTI